MANIPGLLVCPAAEGSGEGITIPSFTVTNTVPESQIYGNCRSVNDFERLGIIEEGSFGVIYKCRNKKTGGIIALKKFKMPTDFQDGIPKTALREIHIHNSLKHDNIVNYHGTVAGKKLESNYLILDYGVFSLKELVEKKVDAIHHRSVIKCMMRQYLQGLDYIHSGLIVHRNINPQNIVFTDKGILKITGFQASRFYNKGNMSPAQTELMYRAPEVLFHADMYGPAIDMWATGCVFAYLLLKKPLFVGESELEVLKSIFNVLGTPSEEIWPQFDTIFAQYDGDRRIITEVKPYNELSQYFPDESTAVRDMLHDLLIYFPTSRPEASKLTKGPYFNENPPGCSISELATIIQNAEAPGEPMKVV